MSWKFFDAPPPRVWEAVYIPRSLITSKDSIMILPAMADFMTEQIVNATIA
jgi:hypothetical protein